MHTTVVVCILVCILEYSRSSATVRFHGMHTMHTTTLLLPVAMDIGSMYTISLKRVTKGGFHHTSGRQSMIHGIIAESQSLSLVFPPGPQNLRDVNVNPSNKSAESPTSALFPGENIGILVNSSSN